MTEEEEEVLPPEGALYGIDDTGVYAQTLSNTILALVKWRTETDDERVFVRMQLKRLVDAQVGLKVLYVDD